MRVTLRALSIVFFVLTLLFLLIFLVTKNLLYAALGLASLVIMMCSELIIIWRTTCPRCGAKSMRYRFLANPNAVDHFICGTCGLHLDEKPIVNPEGTILFNPVVDLRECQHLLGSIERFYGNGLIKRTYETTTNKSIIGGIGFGLFFTFYWASVYYINFCEGTSNLWVIFVWIVSSIMFFLAAFGYRLNV